jgi:urocanate hydratase
MAERAEDPQSAALRAFTLLSGLRADWRGALIVACGLGSGGSALSVAANIAGAGCLVIEPQAEISRAALRSGACDFVVNTVDEALRVLKNEIRQRRAVSVGLTLGWAAALDELLDRGALPEMFTSFADGAGAAEVEAAARAFATLGTLLAAFDGPSGEFIDASARLQRFIEAGELHLEAAVFSSSEELRAFDARLAEVIPATDPRQRWCAGAPRFFHRDRPYRRVSYLTADERERLGAR